MIDFQQRLVAPRQTMSRTMSQPRQILLRRSLPNLTEKPITTGFSTSEVKLRNRRSGVRISPGALGLEESPASRYFVHQPDTQAARLQDTVVILNLTRLGYAVATSGVTTPECRCAAYGTCYGRVDPDHRRSRLSRLKTHPGVPRDDPRFTTMKPS